MLVWVLLGMVALGIVGLSVHEHWRRRETRRASPVSTDQIAAAARGGGVMGLKSHCAVVGTVEPGVGGTVRAPLSGMSCVWYRVVVASYRRIALGSLWHGRWMTSRTNPQSFVVRDVTGSVVVVPETGAPLSWRPSFSRVERAAWGGYQPRSSLAGRVQRLTGTHGSLALQPGTPYEFVEWTLLEGDRVYVSGRAEMRTGAGPGASPDQVILRVARKGPFFLTKGSRYGSTPLSGRVVVGYAIGFGMLAAVLGHFLAAFV